MMTFMENREIVSFKNYYLYLQDSSSSLLMSILFLYLGIILMINFYRHQKNIKE